MRPIVHKFNKSDKEQLLKILAHEYFENKKEYTVRSLDNILSVRNKRNIANWEKDGILLAEDVEPNVKRFYSFLEVVWIHIVVKLRSFGYPLKDIKNLKHYLLETRNVNDLLTFASAKIEEISEKDLSASDQEKVRKELSNEEVYGQLFKEVFEWNYSILNTLIAESIQLRKSVYLVITAKGFPKLLYEKDWADKELFSSGLLSQTVLIIPIHEIIRDIIQDEKQNFIVPKLGILDEHEWEVLQELKRNNLIELTINTQNKEFYILKAKTKTEVDPETRLLDHILKDGYQEIQYKTKKGKLVHFTNTFTTRITIEKKL